MLKVLVGNKSDLEELREVTFEQGQKYADEHEMLFFECSAKAGFNVEEIFRESAERIYGKVLMDEDIASNNFGISLGNQLASNRNLLVFHSNRGCSC